MEELKEKYDYLMRAQAVEEKEMVMSVECEIILRNQIRIMFALSELIEDCGQFVALRERIQVTNEFLETLSK